jgi:NAD(P)-dependent dehydrogenase (short-subunit alcohol dehydrogenase family)
MSTIQDKFNLTGKSAIVTGGIGLIGREFCRTLAEAGASVLVADIDGDTAEVYATELRSAGFDAGFARVNVTDPESVRAMVDCSVDLFGGLDILVTCAAMDPKFDSAHEGQHGNTFEDFPLDAWKSTIDVNLTGMFLCCQAAAREMVKKNSGSIINICSTYGLVGPDQRIYIRPGQPRRTKPVYYSVSKAGVLGLVRYMATYYAGTNIRANALTPGGIFNDHDDLFVQNYSARTVLGRMAHKDEMNGALLFLASDASSYMTGGNLVVDGGWTAW